MAINSSNLPTTYTFKFEDYPDAPEFFAQFLQQLNLFANPIYQIMNGSISYQNLMIPKIFTKTITAPATGNTTFSFANPLKIAPSAVIIGNIYVQNQANNHPTDPAVVYWHVSEGNIYVDQITNLTASTTYVVTLVVF